MSARLRACWQAARFARYWAGVSDRLRVLRFRVRRWLHFRAETRKRLDTLDAKFGGLMAAMQAVVNEDSGTWPAYYQAAADIQARRRQMHLVQTEASQ